MVGIRSGLALTFAIVVLTTANVVWARKRLSEKEIDAWNHVQKDVITCVAYFNFGKACVPKNAKPDELKHMDQMIDKMNDLALAIASRIGAKDRADEMFSRVRQAMKEQADLTERSCTNFTLLTTRYQDRCNSLGKDPEASFREYMNK
jgi:hypothetical protein